MVCETQAKTLAGIDGRTLWWRRPTGYGNLQLSPSLSDKELLKAYIDFGRQTITMEVPLTGCNKLL
jgi:hypothetical protein